MTYLDFTYVRISELMVRPNLSLIPQTSGVYVIDIPENSFIPEISNSSTCPKFFKGRSLLYSAEELQTKFMRSDRKRLYIGKAKNLRQRISKMIRYGMGENVPHRGGRAIWQITNARDLLFGWCPCLNPRNVEHEMLIDYLCAFGVYPMANWRA